MYPLVLSLLVALLAGMVACRVWLARGRRRERPGGFCHCPHCRQKLRYRVLAAGERVLCPRCVRAFRPLPAVLGSKDGINPLSPSRRLGTSRFGH